MKGLYYYTKKIYQFGQSKPIFEILGGKIVTISLFPLTFLYFLIKHGPFRMIIMHKSLRKLPNRAKGLVLGHSANNHLPEGSNYDRVFVYHGTSDKTFSMPDKKLDIKWFGYFFHTGPKDLYKLKNNSHNSELLDERVVKIGMFRSDLLFKGIYDREEILKKYGIDPGSKKWFFTLRHGDGVEVHWESALRNLWMSFIRIMF